MPPKALRPMRKTLSSDKPFQGWKSGRFGLTEGPAFSLARLRYGARMTRTAPIALSLACLLAACGPGENDPGPGGVTVGEAQALDEAAAMLEARKLPPQALDNPPAPAQDTDLQTQQAPEQAQQ
ncbi:hypothetical protein ELI_12020 [Erythrobacter litoralis HTCC2594]|uniref:Uncharacterized protein n=2 Tax=Erythrobacter litoralis TaxID=39960 RepID=Q2N745_ERYLH|nr:hypothetical protein ELI_12020 [Erythrobacter litoralis HTCC2594]